MDAETVTIPRVQFEVLINGVIDHSNSITKLTAVDAAKYLGVNVVTLWRMRKEGKVSPDITVGRRNYFSKNYLDNYLKKGGQGE